MQNPLKQQIVRSPWILCLVFFTLGGCRAMAPPPPPPPPPVVQAPAPLAKKKIIQVPTRDYLERGEVERFNYGLFAYVLLPSRSESKAQQYEALFNAYLDAFESAPDMEGAGFRAEDMAVTYWLLKEGKLSGEVFDRERSRDAGFFVKKYDYARAQAILARFQLQGRKGPFLVAHVIPLGGSPVAPVPNRDSALVMDFGRFGQEDYPQAFRWFQQKVTSDPATWQAGFDLEGMRLGLRSVVMKYADSALALVKVAKGQ